MAPDHRIGHPIQACLTIVGMPGQPTKQNGGRQDDALQTSTELHHRLQKAQLEMNFELEETTLGKPNVSVE
jgi:hypothetical protein